MTINGEVYKMLDNELKHNGARLTAVSKTKPVEDILALYQLGQRDFGENYVQEIQEKQKVLPADIRWHFIGHLQSNKVKAIAPFVYLIHGVDSIKLLTEINKQAGKFKRIINCLLQVHIAAEETKFGFSGTELQAAVSQLAQMDNIKILGLMGMASFTADTEKLRKEFRYLKQLFDQYKAFETPGFKMNILSMGMSGDYKIAIEEGSNMVRIGSLLFGSR